MYDIKTLRKMKGWTQSQLAKESKVAQSAISDIESGKRDPSYGVMNKIVTALGMEIVIKPKAHIFDEEDQPA